MSDVTTILVFFSYHCCSVRTSLSSTECTYWSHARNCSTSVVFSPTEDGGYLLVGVAGELPPIFEAMKWSHPDVMLQTVGRLDAARRRYRLLRTLWDVDDAAGWARWQTS